MKGSIFQIHSVAGVTLFYQKLSCHYGHSSKHIDSVAHIQNEAVIILRNGPECVFSFDVLSTWCLDTNASVHVPYRVCHCRLLRCILLP